MDCTVFGLYASGLAATIAGTGLGAVDVTHRVRRYRDAAKREDTAPPDWFAGLDSIQRRQASKSPAIVSAQARQQAAAQWTAMQHAEARLAALFGTSVAPLLIGVGLVLLGALLSGAADLLAIWRA